MTNSVVSKEVVFKVENKSAHEKMQGEFYPRNI